MKLVKASVSEIQEQNILKKIELCGRVCYKSEDKITDTSCVSFVDMLIKRQHLAMTEHAPLVLSVTQRMAESILKLGHGTYLNVTINGVSERYIISGSVRAWYLLFTSPYYRKIADSTIQKCESYLQMSLGKELYSLLFPNTHTCGAEHNYLLTQEEILQLPNLQDYEAKTHLYLTAYFICDRGVSHELVRHRPASFAQESTRYCNYSREVFGKEITYIDPVLECESFIMWSTIMKKAEQIYFELLDWGLTPQEARGVLPTDLKTEIIMTCNLAEWQHVFNLRYHGTTGAPHPHMKQIMSQWFNIVKNKKGYSDWIV